MIKTLALAAAQAGAQPATVPEPGPIPPIEQAAELVAAHDATLFWYAFEGCDADPIEPLLTENFRMVHDLAGLVAGDRQAFVAQIRQDCAARAEGGPQEGYKNRRLLVPGSRSVTRLGDWGVLERGMHTFHELRQRPPGIYGDDDPGGPTWIQTGGARYIHVWQWNSAEGRFQLDESISVDHGESERYPPEGIEPG